MINTFVMSGEVKRIEVNTKPTRKGPAAMILLQYGSARQRTNQPVQFVHLALIRIPPYIYEKCKDDLKEGSLVDVTGHMQGVLKQAVVDGYVTNEMVADRLQVVDAEQPEAEAEAEAE